VADITKIFDGGFTKPIEVTPAAPEDQVRSSMLEFGLEPPAEIIIDGKIHRFRAGTKGRGGHGDKTGWYIIFPDGVPAGRFGCWRAGIEAAFKADVGRKLTQTEEMAHARRMSEAKQRRDEERAKKQEVVAETVETIWQDCTVAQDSHPYLVKKGVKANGTRVTGDGRLVVPLYTDQGSISSLQYIDADGGKLYHSGGKTGGAFWQVGTMDDAGTLYIAEGFATAATIYQETGRPCVIAYSASNLVPVTGTMREKYGSQQQIVIVADNDQSGVGQKYADQASAKYGARVVIPPISGDANDYVQAGHDLAELLTPKKSDWLIPADEFSAKPAPLSWSLKRWLPSTGLVMMHGPSGGGKTFVVLDWCLAIAAGLEERMGHKVNQGTVVYLAGEGHHGLRGRIAVWKQHNNVDSLDMYLSRDGCDLNTPEGYQRVVENIRSTDAKPALIVVDTLHRFLAGDENSAQDTKTMLDACGGLITEFDCSVVLVHHTGVNSEAQHRARGSSAWRGALDIEISIVPASDNGDPMEIIQRKSKDAEIAETMYCRLDSVAIRGWYDEDNEPVTSAVVRQVDASEKKEKAKAPSQIDKHRKLIERAYWHGGAEVREDMPYISRSAFKEMLENDGNSTGTIRNYVKPSYENGPIATLINGEIIATYEHGWIVTDQVMASALLMARGADAKK
jgi:putative DNA primase/helicase